MNYDLDTCHALSIYRAQNFGHGKTAWKVLVLVANNPRACLWKEKATIATVVDAFVTNLVSVRALTRLLEDLL